MNKQDLLRLERAASLTPAEMKLKEPVLFKKLGENVSVRLKNNAVEKLKNAPKKIKDEIAKIDFGTAKLGKKDVKSVLSASLKNSQLSVTAKKKLDADLAKIPRLGKLDDLLQPDMPVLINPVFQKDLMKAKALRLVNATRLPAAKIDKLLARDIVIGDFSNEKLSELVKDNTLTDNQAKDIGLTTSLHTLFDNNFELTEFVSKGNVPNVTGHVKSLKDLIALEKADWGKIVADTNVELPKDLKAKDYGEVLYKKVENLFPNESMAHKVPKIKSQFITKGLTGLKPLLDRNDKIFGLTVFEDLKTNNLTAAKVKKLKAQHQDIERLIRLHPGLELDKVLNDKNSSTADKGKLVVERIGLFDTFVKNNPAVDYLSASYTHESQDIKAMDFTGIKAQEKGMVINSLKAYQRVNSVTDDIENTEVLLVAGYPSAYHITSSTLDRFTKVTNLDPGTATRIYENAHESIVRTTGIFGSILDLSIGSFNWTNVGNTGPSVNDYLKDIPGYDDLFGKMAFCDCEHCQSIHSPAAYFVDLMKFIESHVIDKHFSDNSTKNHVLNLKVRRPDLWTLPLTCENTTTFVPNLDLINEILETYIANKKGFAGDLNDRGLVEAFVYEKEIAVEKPGNWKSNIHSFSQPFHLPLESLNTYLGHFERTREQIAILLKQPKEVISNAKLNLSQKDYKLITEMNNSPAFIQRIYGVNFSMIAGKIKPVDAQIMLKPMGLKRKELGKILATRYVTSNAADNIVIQGGKIDSDSIQNDIERIKNLTFSTLDRAHRFVRLWKKSIWSVKETGSSSDPDQKPEVSSWSIEELDMVLNQLDAIGISQDIDAASVTEIGALLSLQAVLNVTTEELCALWGTIPSVSIKDEQKSMLDVLFNHDDVVSIEGTYPKDVTPFIHPALIVDGSTGSADYSSARLMAALNRSDSEILTLIQNLSQPLGIANINSVTESERGFNLNIENISLLYSHSKIASILDISIAELFQLMKLDENLANGYFENAAHIKSILEFHKWWKTTDFSMDELHFIIKSSHIVDPDGFTSKEDVSQKIIKQAKSENAMTFANTLLAYHDDITEEQSKSIIMANSSIIELSPDGINYWLTQSYDPDQAIIVPAGISVNESELRDILDDFHPVILIPHLISSQLNIDKEPLRLMLDALGTDLKNSDYLEELTEVTTPAVEIPQLIEKLIPVSVLFKNKKYGKDVLNYVFSNLDKFDIASIDSITVDNIKKLHIFCQFLSKQEDGSYNINLLRDVLSAFDNILKYQSADQDKLAKLLNSQSNLLTSIHPLLISSSDALNCLGELVKLTEVTSHIGIGGDILPLIVSNSYGELQSASNGILAAFRSKYQSESERIEKLEIYQDKLRSKKRASLTTYLIHSGFPQFESEKDLFHYFLIDTELEGCARTSRLVAATMSLQLYIHRILLNLEQDKKDLGANDKVQVKADDIPGDEWQWRKNYRVWEANRKIFLYPENYIEPELRDNKTPLFEELESELLQQEINADTTLDAYAKYMRGFDEVAHLKIAGSFHEKDENTKTDILHLFGVTAAEPPTYYYRAVENTYYSEKVKGRGIIWNPWQKINVQIPVRKVAPIIFNGRLHVFWVKITSLSQTTFDDNRSIFTGYDHKFSIEFTTLKLDGSWTTSQKLNLYDNYPFTGNGVMKDPLMESAELDELSDIQRDLYLAGKLEGFQGYIADILDLENLADEITALKTPRYGVNAHVEPIDEYTLSGFMWDQVYPTVHRGRLVITAAGYQMIAAIDHYNLSTQIYGSKTNNGRESYVIEAYLPSKIFWFQNETLYSQVPASNFQWFYKYAYCSLVVNATKFNPIIDRHWDTDHIENDFNDNGKIQIAKLNKGSSVDIINGAYSDAVIDDQGDTLLVQGTPLDNKVFLLKRLGTTLSETLTRTLFTSGVDIMLDIDTQKELKEAPTPISITQNRIINQIVSDKIDFNGSYGTYYREIFFHIPFLLANYLNSQGKYAEAQKWYNYIFDPSANEVIDLSGPSLTSAQKKKIKRDRNWQYLEFREINTQSLRAQLNDKQAIENYKKDPFNPHAIARLRMSAYQKSIVMKYVDNLLDWGDQLFSQDTMESVNEATFLYIIAQEILGEKPVELGDCGEGEPKPKTYENIGPLLDNGSEFFAELEHYTYIKIPHFNARIPEAYAINKNSILFASRKAANDVNVIRGIDYSAKALTALSNVEIGRVRDFNTKRMPEVTIKAIDDAVTAKFSKGSTRSLSWKKGTYYVADKLKLPSFGKSILSHVSPVFCVPGNKELLKYWDRVGDRMYKIHNCMNISGQRRQLALFASEIDPRILVRAKAAGLELDEILNSIGGDLPPYRFSYIIERAKSYTSVVQSFGASLLSAMEKRDGEELVQLRMLHQQNILETATKSRNLEIKSADEGIKILNDRIESLTYRVDYYDGLISQNLNNWERTQSIAKHTSSSIKALEPALFSLSGVLGLLPQVGSPFAMKYGGVELKEGPAMLAHALNATADFSNIVASSAGLEAGFARRKQGWKHQKKLVESELKQAEKSLITAGIRREILVENYEIHQKNIEHNDEVMEFYGDKFSNLGLFTWLSSTMQQLFKEAFNNANAIAKLAEQAYRFERDDDTIFIEGTYFEAPRAGLLSGEMLFMKLQEMERRYLETNYRKLEIDQAFSITQLDPAALLILKQSGTCEFSIPEVFFDLSYPGQYRRKIQSVRLSIPSVTGPYTNVSANLSLVRSDIRMEAKLGNANLNEVPKSRTTNIATSTAQNDAGVFQLNFRDDRYMPFEGAGAISSWKLSLPKNFRQFDYNTINDVIIHVSYMAEYDETFRDKVEDQNSNIEGSIIEVLKNNNVSRTFSFRQEFSTDFNRLIHQPVNQPIVLKIENKHFPYFLNGKSLKVNKAKLILLTAEGQSVNNVDIAINGTSITGFAQDAQLGGLFSKDLGNLFDAGIIDEHTITISAGGDLTPPAPGVGNVAAIDDSKLEDIFLYVEFSL